jgi:hypothetical protein
MHWFVEAACVSLAMQGSAVQSAPLYSTSITALCLLLQVEKGTQGIDSIVISNKGKGELRMWALGTCACMRAELGA